MHRCFILCIEYESNELKDREKRESSLFCKGILSEEELDDTPEKQVVPAVSCKLTTIVFLHTQTTDSPCQKQTIFLVACKSLSSVFFIHQKQILFI